MLNLPINAWVTTPHEIITEHLKGSHLKQGEIDRLKAQGVPGSTLWKPTQILTDRVTWLARDRFEFERYAHGGTVVNVFTFLIGYDFQATDIAAWEPATGHIATWLGRAFALGEEQLCVCLSDDPLQIWRTPLRWLQNHRDGLVILKPDWALERLADVPAVAAEDKTHGWQIERLFIPRHRPKVLIPAQDARAA